ncbi:MAG: 50S ribosomal protein L28 [Fusobacteriia bacterium 4572_132]|nr:MAG: 50S ribosomal protein L28 [Fusobacteriia bacterium 4572_132]
MKTCDLCGKGAVTGNSVSHAHNKTKRVWRPNIQKATIMLKGEKKKVNICTKCLKSVERV